MDLVLTVTDGPKEANMTGHTKTFTSEGGCFGRSTENDWMLPDLDRVVSSTHARIEWKDNNFKIIDVSTNGTYINDAKEPIGSQNSRVLNKGDILLIGDYRLSVDIINTNPALPSGLESVDFLDQTDKTQFSNATPIERNNADDDFDSWLSPPRNEESQQITPALSEQDSWGTSSAETTPLASNNLQSITQHNQNNPFATPASIPAFSNNDPIGSTLGLSSGQLGSGANSMTASSAMNSDDDWWNSEQEHCDPMSQSIQVPAHQPPPSHGLATQNNSLQETNNISPDNLPKAPVNQAIPPQAATTTQNTAFQTAQFEQPFITQPHTTASNQIPSAPLGHVPQSLTRRDATQTPTSPAEDHTKANSANQQIAKDFGLSTLNEQQLESLSPELALIVKETLNRLIDLLRARSSIKNELRVDRTMIETNNNNPLKFSASADDALSVMFNGQNSTFMSPHHAISDGFDDISDHQVAVMSGMKAAYEAMLEQLSPEKMQAIGEQQIKSGLLSNKKAQLWDLYQNRFQTLRADNEQCYKLLFGDFFSSAYEKQLADLKSTRSLTKK
ncbi:FHA domain protein [Sinobacterium caligoides]|uniref:FHA domain protein n=1 Tax=Sinobacterium caligoides TaxID=933926 RepID=A0A3N2DJQ6_9GAMM|nr:type VI secretion system-associated FHA domain protein TagH [Sinobacterium caligoides]ROS00034.1 FHA domain protein [Sinobacterium caligoides]